jgi:hypothetical protein
MDEVGLAVGIVVPVAAVALVRIAKALGQAKF